MARIQARVQVHLPHDSAGVSAVPGQIIEVDTDNAAIMGYLTVGYLVPIEPLDFAARLTAGVVQADGKPSGGAKTGTSDAPGVKPTDTPADAGTPRKGRSKP